MYKVPGLPKTPDIRLGADGNYPLDGGINLQFQETALGYNQSPYILNLNADDRGTLKKRDGQANFDTSLGAGGINGVALYKGKIIKAWGTGLYSENLDGSNCTQIYSGITSNKVFFFIKNGILYLLNGYEYLQYDGSTVKSVLINPYIPTITQGRKPDGSQSNLREPLNFISGQYIDSFSSDGTATYVLSYQGLDSIDEVKVNGAVLSSGFTKDLVNGKVVFTAGPATAAPNNVLIKWTKNSLKDVNQIIKCTRAVEFSDSMWLTGNPDYPNRLWKTGLTDVMEANYFPASGMRSFSAIGGIDQAVTNFIKHYNKFIILKEKSTHTTYEEKQSDGSIGFPYESINANIGCDIPYSIQLINNNPVWANSYGGVHIMVSTILAGEKNIIHISQNIDGLPERPGLLQEDINELKKASSFDDGRKYYLCVGKKVYVWDYSLGYDLNKPETLHWFIYDNINASQFLMIGNTFCYANRDTGVICKFISAKNDFGNSIKGIWRSKLMDFNLPEWYKNITYLAITTRANSDSLLKVNYYNDNGELIDSAVIPRDSVRSFDWDNWDWDNFTWDYQRFNPTIPFRPPVRGVRYFQLELINDNYNEDLSIVNIVIQYSVTKKVR